MIEPDADNPPVDTVQTAVTVEAVEPTPLVEVSAAPLDTVPPPVDAPPMPAAETEGLWIRAGREIVAGVKTLVSAAIYATLIVTFGFQIARVDGLSMAPTLEDHDRLIVNKLVYELSE